MVVASRRGDSSQLAKNRVTTGIQSPGSLWEFCVRVLACGSTPGGVKHSRLSATFDLYRVYTATHSKFEARKYCVEFCFITATG